MDASPPPPDAARAEDRTVVAVRSVAHGGAGVGQALGPDGAPQGPTWFVQGALPGESVEAVAEHRSKRFVRGRAVAIVERAAARVEPSCPIADRCGGCAWQHVALDAQGALKRRIVADQLRALVSDDAVRLHDAAPSALAYRRRARLHYECDDDGVVRVGFFAAGTKRLVDVQHCPVLEPPLDAALQRLRAHRRLLLPQGEVFGLTDGTHAVLALTGVRPEPDAVAEAKAMLDDTLVGVLLRGGRQTHSVGQTKLALDEGGGNVAVLAGPLSFAQAHGPRNAALVRHVVGRAKPDGLRVLELFCGNGNFTRALARTARRVWALDDDRDAIGALRAIAEQHRLPINAKRGSAKSWLSRMHQGGTRYDVVVLDPTRRGLGEREAADLAHVATSRIVYVSCDPATLARDLKVLAAHGWGIDDVTVFDLMPMTPEVETVVTLRRVAGQGWSAT